MSDEEEYEIESILEARVGKVKKRKQWQFHIRWKGYSPNEDTWEPIEHMAGSEEALEHFLQRINTNGRDHRNLALFEEGEVFIPIGPPRRRKDKGKETVSKNEPQLLTTPNPDLPPPSRGRKRDLNDTGTQEDHSFKRPRPTPQTFGSKPNILLTDAGSPLKSTPTKYLASNPPSEPHPSPGWSYTAPPESSSMDVLLDFSEEPSTSRLTPVNVGTADMSIVTPPSTKPIKPTMPLHRARLANPLVKSLPHPDASVKARGAGEPNQVSNPGVKIPSLAKRKKPGPGRSSDGLIIRPSTLLTAEKGKLKSVKGKRKAEERSRELNHEDDEKHQENISESGAKENVLIDPPKPGELLHLAGFELNLADLPGFEDDNAKTTPKNQDTKFHPNGNSLPPSVKESLFPTVTSGIESHPEWKRPTIFGLLGIGTDTSSTLPGNPFDESSVPFQINLDSSTCLPILFVDQTSTSTFPTDALFQSGPPGKFYRGPHATDLLATLRSKSSFARVLLSPQATELHATNFKHFVKRLCSDELFVEMIGRDLLAFCSSSNAFFTQRLNIVPSLLSGDAIVVAHVSIENQSAFADVATNADDTIWSQYILTAGPV